MPVFFDDIRQRRTGPRRLGWSAGLCALLLLGILLSLVGCGGGSSNGSTATTLSISPSTVTLALGGTQTFTATLAGVTGISVTWSVKEGSSGGTITSAGVYTAPNTAGTYHVVATSTANTSQSATATVTVTTTTGSTIVSLANAYIAALSSSQQSATVVSSSASNAAKWSNLPANPTISGTNNLRNGVAYSTLTSAQKTAWANLVNAALSGQPLTQESQIRAADSYLNSLNSGYSGDYQYVAFVGTPSTSGSWMLQIGGHHNAHNFYYNGTTLQTTTPYFLGVEPTSFAYNGTAYTPLSA